MNFRSRVSKLIGRDDGNYLVYMPSYYNTYGDIVNGNLIYMGMYHIEQVNLNRSWYFYLAGGYNKTYKLQYGPHDEYELFRSREVFDI